MPAPNPNPPIRTINQLEEYLNRTKDKHRGNGFNEFLIFIRTPGLPFASIAKLMGVKTTKTVQKWYEIIEASN